MARITRLSIILISLSVSACNATTSLPFRMHEAFERYKDKDDLKVLVGSMQGDGHTYDWRLGQTKANFDFAIKDALRECNEGKFKFNIVKPCVVHFVGNENVRHLNSEELAEFIKNYKDSSYKIKKIDNAGTLDVATICRFALNATKDGWDTRVALQKYVKEADKRSISPADCEEAI